MHIQNHYASKPPSSSPLSSAKKQDMLEESARYNLRIAERRIHSTSQHHIEVSAVVSHGDAIRAISNSIEDWDQLRIFAQYLVHFLPAKVKEGAEVYVIEEMLAHLRTRLENYLESHGGVEHVIQRNLELTFPESGAVKKTSDDQDIESCLEVIEKIKKLDKLAKYIRKTTRDL